MQRKIIAELNQNYEDTIALAETLFQNPELGFKEFKTRKILIDYFKNHGIDVWQEFAYTGFAIRIGNQGANIGLIAEMDAIPTPNHPFANHDDYAAHACGHSTQCAIMASVMVALKKYEQELTSTITLYFTPAEEFTDLEYRKKLVQENKITSYAGKREMLLHNLEQQEDLFIHLHAMGETNEYDYAVNSTLAGFTYKKYNFIGKASHAAVLPHEGVNALNIFTLFQSAVAMLRETFIDEDKNRIHGIITHGGDTVNSIPESVVYEGYIRTFNADNLLSLAKTVDNAALCCSQALGGSCNIETIPGYLPFYQNHELSNIVYQQILNFTIKERILVDERSVASGDIGDLGLFKPAIQFGYTGFKGRIHGSNLTIENYQKAYLEPSKIVALTIVQLINHPEIVQDISDNFKPIMTKAEYLRYLDL